MRVSSAQNDQKPLPQFNSSLEKVRIAARQSDLARLQAYRVGEAITAKFPTLKIEYSFRASLGDINLNDPLWKMPEKGVFTEDFLKDLIEGTADLVVHSWKDLPTHPRPETVVVATLPRADIRDVLLFRKDRMDAAKKNGRARILTSSPRRSYNLGDFLKTHLPLDLKTVEFQSVRGNIPTRLKKLLAEDVEGLIVAKAALDRLLEAKEPEFQEAQKVIRGVLSKTNFMVLPLSVNPTAAAQGALAIETSRARQDVIELLHQINCQETFKAVEEERSILASHGGGCHQKIGVSILPRQYGKVTFQRGLTDAGQVLDEIRLESKNSVSVKAENARALFPSPGEESTFFFREVLPKENWGWVENERFLWVSRETAWPAALNPKNDAIVWTAGLKTWGSLARKGVWVTGSSEGMGEEEPTGIESLVEGSSDPHGVNGSREIPWVKLTHQLSKEGLGRLCATYRLGTNEKPIDLSARSHFFWMSGSSFDRAVELFPNIRFAHHSSGPGLTHRHLRRILGPDIQLGIYLSLDAWRKDVVRGQ